MDRQGDDGREWEVCLNQSECRVYEHDEREICVTNQKCGLHPKLGGLSIEFHRALLYNIVDTEDMAGS